MRAQRPQEQKFLACGVRPGPGAPGARQRGVYSRPGIGVACSRLQLARCFVALPCSAMQLQTPRNCNRRTHMQVVERLRDSRATPSSGRTDIHHRGEGVGHERSPMAGLRAHHTRSTSAIDAFLSLRRVSTASPQHPHRRRALSGGALEPGARNGCQRLTARLVGCLQTNKEEGCRMHRGTRLQTFPRDPRSLLTPSAAHRRG